MSDTACRVCNALGPLLSSDGERGLCLDCVAGSSDEYEGIEQMAQGLCGAAWREGQLLEAIARGYQREEKWKARLEALQAKASVTERNAGFTFAALQEVSRALTAKLDREQLESELAEARAQAEQSYTQVKRLNAQVAKLKAEKKPARGKR